MYARYGKRFPTMSEIFDRITKENPINLNAKTYEEITPGYEEECARVEADIWANGTANDLRRFRGLPESPKFDFPMSQPPTAAAAVWIDTATAIDSHKAKASEGSGIAIKDVEQLKDSLQRRDKFIVEIAVSEADRLYWEELKKGIRTLQEWRAIHARRKRPSKLKHWLKWLSIGMLSSWLIFQIAFYCIYGHWIIYRIAISIE